MMIREIWITARGNAPTTSDLIRACKICGISQDEIEAFYAKKALDTHDTPELPFQVESFSMAADTGSILPIKDQKVTFVKKESDCRRIENNGGNLELSRSGIILEIPAAALQRRCKIQMTLHLEEKLINLNSDEMSRVNIIELMLYRQESVILAVIRRRVYYSQGIECCVPSNSREYFHYGKGSSQKRIV